MSHVIESSLEIRDIEISVALSENVYPSDKLYEIWDVDTTLLVAIIFNDDSILLACDNDPRPVKNEKGEVVSRFRPGRSTYKCSFGYRGTPDTILKEGGPADISLMGTLSPRVKSLEMAEFFYRESGSSWIVITIPYYYTGSKNEWLSDLNIEVLKQSKVNNPWLYNFIAIPRTLCFTKDSKGSPALFDDEKYVRVTYERTTYTLWDEQQFRDQTLSLLNRFESI